MQDEGAAVTPSDSTVTVPELWIGVGLPTRLFHGWLPL